MSKILIKNGIVIDVENKNNTGLKDILIENNYIKKIDKDIQVEDIKKENENDLKIIDASSNIVMPGYINTHSHIAMNFLKGYADGLNLMDWLNKKIWPIEDKLNSDDIYKSSKAGILEMIKTGTTTFLDMYFLVDATIKAAKESKIRTVISRCIMDTKDNEDIRIKETLELIHKYCNKDDMINIMVGPHSPYVCSKDTLKRCVKIAKENNISMHIHLAETQDEIKIIKEKYNMTPFELLKEIGALEIPLVIAHGVWATDSDIKLLKNIKGGIAHNPVSNAKLASGIAPITKYIKEGINVSLGTDGNCSTNTLDMFLEMKLANYMQKVSTLDSTCIDAYTTIQLATINGAKVLNMEDKIGSIKEGKYADIIIIDGKSIRLNPLNDVYSNIVYSASGEDVLTTIINGEVVMEDRKLCVFDEKIAIDECNNISKKYCK